MKTTPSAADRYLWHRPQSRSIWFRMAVPKEHRDRAGKRIIQRPLGTTDRREASILAGKLRAELFEQWIGGTPAIGVARSPAASEIDAAAVRYGYELMRGKFDESRRKLSGDEAEWQAYKAERLAQTERRTRQIQTGDLTKLHDAATGIAVREGWKIEPGSPLFQTFVERLATASLDAMSVERRQLAGELEAAPSSALVKRELERAAATAAPGETLLELFDRYAERRLAEGAKRADVLKQDRKVIEQFSEFVGRSRRVDSITAVDVRDYRDTMFRLPTRWKDRKELAGLSMRQAAAQSETTGLPRMSMVTINKYLSTISPVFAWLIQEKWNISNPCDGLFYQKVKGRNPRPPFNSSQLNVILRSPLFVGFAGDGAEHKSGGERADDWRYWLPLLAMFTGARIGELAQLHIEDLEQHETGVWFVTIRHDEARGQTTKSGHSRPAVIHSQLIKLGFLGFVERQRKRSAKDGKPQLFPELEANDRDQIGARPSEFWRDYLTAIGVKSGRDGYGAHSFRHTMADRLREEAGLLDDQVEVALGHNQKTVTSGYGRIRQGTVPLLSGMVEQVSFKGVTMEHLLPRETAAAD